MTLRYLVLLEFFFFIFILPLQSQEYYPLPDSNATWIVSDESSAGSYNMEYGLSAFLDDTIINSINYTKIYIKGISEVTEYAGAFRNDTNGRTYFVPPYWGYIEEHLWYDFNLGVGDTAFDIALNHMGAGFYGTYNLIVDSINYLDAGPYNLKCQFLSPIPPDPPWYSGNPLVWVEKIGSLNGGIYNQYMCGASWTSLRCMSVDDTIYYFSPIIDCDFWYEIVLSYEYGVCTLPPTTVKEEELNNLNIYYVNDKIIIQNPPSDQLNVEIYNLIGLLLFKADLNSRNEHEITIDHQLSSGIYLINIRTINYSYTYKIYKK